MSGVTIGSQGDGPVLVPIVQPRRCRTSCGDRHRQYDSQVLMPIVVNNVRNFQIKSYKSNFQMLEK